MTVRYEYAIKNRNLFIKIIGTARYTEANEFSAFVTKVLSGREYEDILVDLTETIFLDSTNLGLLAKLAGYVVMNYDHKMTLVSTNQEINTVLLNTGFDQIMTLITDPLGFKHSYSIITTEENVEENIARMMLDAHLALIELNDKNRQEFKK